MRPVPTRLGAVGAGEYDLLPSSERGGVPAAAAALAGGTRKVSFGSWVRRRRRLVFASVCIVVVVSLWTAYYLIRHPEFWRRTTILKIIGPPTLPPLYPEWREAERWLPQQNVADPFVGGRKYLWLANHPQCESVCAGWTCDRVMDRFV